MEKYKGVNSGQLQYFRVFLATKKHLQEKERIPKVYWAWMGHSKGDFPRKESMVWKVWKINACQPACALSRWPTWGATKFMNLEELCEIADLTGFFCGTRCVCKIVNRRTAHTRLPKLSRNPQVEGPPVLRSTRVGLAQNCNVTFLTFRLKLSETVRILWNLLKLKYINCDPKLSGLFRLFEHRKRYILYAS